MAINVEVKNEFVSPKTDGSDSTKVRPSEWNKPLIVVLAGLLKALDELAPTNGSILRVSGPDSFEQMVMTALGAGLVAAADATVGRGLLQAAPVESPLFTGTPRGPTPNPGDSTQRMATTAFVSAAISALGGPLVTTADLNAAIAALVASAPSTLNTLNEISLALANDPNFSTTITTALGKRLRFDAAQSLTGPEKIQVQANAGLVIGADVLSPTGSGAGLTGLPGGFPVGTSIAYNGTSAPTGFLKENGALVSRTTYATLWAFAQASGRVVTEVAWAATDWGAFGQGDGSTTFRLPDSRGEFIRSLDDSRGIDSARALGSYQADIFKAHTHTVTQEIGGSGAGTTTTPNGNRLQADVTGSTGGAETRPRNVSKLICIKY